MSRPSERSPLTIMADDQEPPSYPSESLFPRFRELSIHAQDDERTPLLKNGQETHVCQNQFPKRSERWWNFLRKKSHAIVVSITLLNVAFIVVSLTSWRLLDIQILSKGGNRQILVRAKHGAVATELDTCSDIGVNILREGGNAVDAAIASGICIGSINMFSAGIGG